MKEVLDCINAKRFFKKYARVQNYTHKMRGKNGIGQPIEFTLDDKVQIKKGIVKMTEDILRKIK